MTARCAFLSAAFAAMAAAAVAAVPGRVISADGKPVGGAVVSAYAPETADARQQRLVAGQERRALATATSGADGSFRLEAADAVAVVGVRAEGFAPFMTTIASRTGDGLTVRLAPVATRRGTVTFGGRPVADAVVAWMANAEDPQSAELVVRTAKDGSYAVPDPDPWARSLAVVHPGFAPLVARADPKWSTSLELSGGVPIQGRVTDEKTGRGVGGAALWLDGWPRTVSAADGSFAIAHAAPDAKRLTARAEGLVGGLDVAAGPLTVVARPARRLSGGVRDAHSKEPVPGAVVVVTDTHYETVASAVTDARGQYEARSLPPGRYRVYASRAGYGYAPDADPADIVDLRKEPASRRDIELPPLPRITGRVIDEQGQPVEGARVCLDWPGMGTLYGDEGTGQIHMVTAEATSLTGPDGGYAIYLTEGFEKGTPSPYQSMGLLALRRGYAAGRAALAPAALDAPVPITLPRGVTIKGRVTAADGAPLGDVAVSVAESGPLLSFRSFSHDADSAGVGDWVRTDPDGRYAVQVHPVVHQLSFYKAGHAPRVIEGFDPRAGEDLDVVLGPAAAIEGRVVRPDGRGLAGATVTLQDAQQRGVGTTDTAADGTFSIADLAPGPYEMQVAKLEAGVQVTRTVEAPAADVRVELGPAVAVHGRVFDAATRAPVMRFSVSVANQAERAYRGEFPDGPAQEYNAADGAFVLEDVPVGGSMLTVSAEGYRPKTVDGVAASADAEAAVVEVALEPGVTVRGRVTDTAGEALPDVRVSGAGSNEEAEGASTDDNGEYAFKGLAPGEVTLRFLREGYRGARRTVQATQATRLDVTLSRGLALSGVVLFEDAGVPGAHVTASSSVTDADSQQAITDAQGRFTLQGLGPGRYGVAAFAEDKGKAEVHDVDSATGGPLRLVIERLPTAILAGTVVGLEEPRDRAPAMVMVQVEGAEGRSSHTFVQMSGTFRIEDAPTGPVMVTAHAMTPGGSRRTSRPRELTLAPGSDNTIVLEFRDDLVVTGIVTSGGAAVPNLAVSFRSAEDSDASASTDREGRYEVRLTPGTYEVTVSGQNVSYETSYVAVDSGSFDIDVTGGTLRGRVVEAGTGTPIAGVEVSLWPAAGRDQSPVTSLQTSAQGTFEAPLVREGSYRIVTARKGYGQEVRDVDVSRGEATDVVLELQPAEGVSVKVTDARDGRPLSATVVVRDRAKRVVASKHAESDADGAVVVPLADGAYLLSTSATGYGTATVPITAPSKGLEVGLTPGGALVIESARALRGRIRLVQPDGEEYVRCWCNGIADITLAGRRTRVENVTPGRYTIEFMDAEVSSPPPVVIREGEVATVTIE